MGVPKFFRYISERYPCLSELAREKFIPDFDNLYLDMNGIIHNCSHPDDSNIHFNLTEDEMFKDIFNYVDKLFFLIKPQKLFYMAVDGVAPRAKMNQQRSRRFRSAKEAETREKLANNRGEYREGERFDSNCITPGTEFMERLQEALRYFIKSKINADPLWQKCRVILSGHNVPGEGEHKIMEYIRYLKAQSDYNPNTRHCLYGLDADLIILGLCTHEHHFVVLREEVKFGRKAKKVSAEETRFFLLHLGLLREYLELEFDELTQQDEHFDIAKLIDDWVLMGFLVGNDFIPHLPCLHISSNALPLLYKTYKKVYSSLGGNINENGKLNLARLEKYFEALAEVEFEIFQDNHADLKYFEAKQQKNGIDEAFDFDVNEINNENIDNDLAAFIESSRQFLEDDEDLSDNDQHINDEFENYKRNYYMNKLNKDNSNSEHTKEQAICYITALQWVLYYYYRGVQSWDWYYPYHYAPFISDLKGFQEYEIKFNIGKPFLPFQQLLAVLPAASKSLLPSAYRDLMTSATSKLAEYYPDDFQVDLNGKQHEWEGVVLIPFIDEKTLLEAMAACDQNLTPSERKRNQPGPILQYDYNPQSQGLVPELYSSKSLLHVFCTEKPIWPNDIVLPSPHTSCVKLRKADHTKFVQGFPTMKHLNYKFELKNARVKVFDYPSRNEAMILQPENRKKMDDVYLVAEKFLHQTVFIGWPHLVKAKVVGISSKEKYIDADGVKDLEPKVFEFQVKAVQEHLLTRMGIEILDYSVLVHVRIHMGTSYSCGNQGKLSYKDVWSSATVAYPAQGVVSDIVVLYSSKNQHKNIEQLFPENSKIFFVGNPYYGSEGIILDPMLIYERGRLKVNITVLPEPDFTEAKFIQRQLESDYIDLFQAAAKIGIHAKSLNRIIGSVQVVKGARRPKSEIPENLSKLNIGLQFKYVKQQEELAGYARRINNMWQLSSKAIALTQLYIERFPAVIEYFSKISDRVELLFEEDLFPTQVGEKKVEEIVAWLKEQNHMKAERVACGSKTIEKESVEKILKAIEHLKALPVKTVKLQVKPHLLLKPDVSLPDAYKPKSQIRLFDRVVIVKTTYMVPLGFKGTVVGIYPVIDSNPVRLECVKAVDNFYEVLFDKHLPNGNDIHGIAPQRVFKVPESSILLIYTQDNIENDNLYDPKRFSSFETDKTQTKQVPGVNEKNKECFVTAFGQSIDVKETPVVHKGSENFWMPAINAKLKHTNAAKTMPNPSQMQSNFFYKNIQPKITEESSKLQQCSDGTQFLKSLLGLSANQAQSMSEPCIAKPQLPQPPTSWRSGAQKISIISHNFPHTQQTKNLSQNVMGGNFLPLPIVKHVVSAHQQPHTQFHQGNKATQQLPQQQQNLSISEDNFNLKSLNQKGAFIPLQVSRKFFPINPQAPSSSSNIQNDAQSHNDIVTQNLNELTLNDGDSSNIDKEMDVQRNTIRKKPPRIPKIGAKFDNAR